MKKINKITDISYKDFKKVEEHLNDVENITKEQIIKVVSVIYNISEEEVKKLTYDLILQYFNLFLVIMGSSPTTLITKFESDGVKYGFIPNFSEITTGELIDLDSLLIERNFEGIASILYRPIINEDKKGRYEIEEYKGYNDKLFENASISFYLGFIDFFFKSFQILKDSSLLYSNKGTNTKKMKS